jgi:hypothetical protein
LGVDWVCAGRREANFFGVAAGSLLSAEPVIEALSVDERGIEGPSELGMQPQTRRAATINGIIARRCERSMVRLQDQGDERKTVGEVGTAQ